MMWRLLLIPILLFFISFSSGSSAEEVGLLSEEPILEPPSSEEVETRTYELGKILRCPVCQGLSVADSRSDAAVAMKNRIKELVVLGYADEQIINYFVQRYGEFTLLKPKDEHWFVWVTPSIVIVVGLSIVALQWRKKQEKEESKESGLSSQEIAVQSEELDSYRLQILKELGDE